MTLSSFKYFSLLILGLASVAYGQVDTGSISGTVRDQTGAVVQDAQVTVVNPSSGSSFATRTNKEGLYTAVDLKAGIYDVSVSTPGFQTLTKSGIDLRLQDRLAINFELILGQASTSVQVQASAPLLETETSSLGHVVENKEIESLPLNGRNYIQLAILGTGTTPSQRSNERNSFVANGQREIQNSYILDGIDNKNKIVGFDSSDAESIEPVLDAIQEFKVQTATFSAEFGQSAGGVVNASIRSGTDQVHGSLFEYLRNSYLDASPFFQPALTAKPQFIQNQYGATLGGPIIKNRTFLFFAWQSSRTNDASPQLGVVPTGSQLQGFFTQPIYNPATTVVNPNGSGYVRALFPGNRILPSSFDPVAAKLIALYPAPNLSGANNFFSNQKETVNNDQYIGRIDHRFSDKDTVFVRYLASFSANTLPAPLPPPASSPSHVGRKHTPLQRVNPTFSPLL